MCYGLCEPLDYCAPANINAGFPPEKLIGAIETEGAFRNGARDTLGANGTIASKVNFAKSHGLAGMMEWRLDNDYSLGNDEAYPTYRGALQLWKMLKE